MERSQRAEGGRMHVYRQDLLGSAARKIAGDALEACWSPDGSRIAILRGMRDSKRQFGVLDVDVRTGEERELYRSEEGLYSLHWSPDGTLISAGTASRSGQSLDQSALLLIPVDDGEARRLPVPGPYMHGHDWVGGEAQSVVYSQSWQSTGDQGGSLSRVVQWNLDSGERRDLFHAEYVHPNLGTGVLTLGASVTVVKDETLAFVSTFVRQLLWEQDIRDGRAVAPGRNLLRGEARDRQPVYSHDGSRIRFASNRTGNLDLWELELESGRLRQLTDDRAQDWDPGFAADGEGLLWSSDRSGAFEIWSAASDGSAARQLSDDGVDAENPCAAPGGEWVVYWSANPEKLGVWRIRADGTSGEPVAEGEYLATAISRDGRWVAFLLQEPHNLRNIVHVAEVATGRVLPFRISVRASGKREDSVTLGRMRWVSDCALSQGPAIAFVGVDEEGRTGVFLQDFDPERDTSVTRRPLAGFRDDLTTESFDISPDGTRITLSMLEITRKLMLAEGVPGIRAPKPLRQ
jgi:Tol biopolymer transport system component